MIRGKGAEAFRERITEARDFFDFQIDRLASKPEFATPRGKMQAARKMAESISLIRDAVLRETVMHRVTQRLEVSAQEFVKLLKAPGTKRADPADAELAKAGPEPITLDPTIHLLAVVALRDSAAREWLLAEPWDTMLQGEPEAELLAKILGADIQPDNDATIHVFLSTLNAVEESVISGLLDEKMPAHPVPIAHDCWRELERRRLRARMETIQARMRAPDLPMEDVAKMQKEILDLQKRLPDISRPLSPASLNADVFPVAGTVSLYSQRVCQKTSRKFPNRQNPPRRNRPAPRRRRKRQNPFPKRPSRARDPRNRKSARRPRPRKLRRSTFRKRSPRRANRKSPSLKRQS
ncbi:MAG: hypothetical protein WDN28_00220 [Chthoniobacter sp.]